MKKICFVLSLFLFSLVSAEEPLHLTGRAVLSNTHGYFVLSDGSCWKVIPFEKRWRSLTEWWGGIELNVPENLESLPQNWLIGAEIEVLAKSFAGDLDHASNVDELKGCSHLLYNVHSEEVLFARAMDPSTLLVSVFNCAYSDGKQAGWADGYTSGYSAGYTAGFNDASAP